MRTRWIWVFVLALPTLVGCGTSTPYYLIESRLIENDRHVASPDVTETPQFAASRAEIATIGLRPPDLCADQGASAGDGAGDLKLGVLRMRCGVEMAELERALARAGYHVVSWAAVQQMAMQNDRALLDSARELGIDVLIQVNALERIEIRPGRDARFERRFFHATRLGEPTEPAFVEPTRARDFEILIKRRESSLASGERVGAKINVSAVRVETGATIWFYEWTQVDVKPSDPRIEILVDCGGSNCQEVRAPSPVSAQGPVEGSISGVSVAGDPANESQAVFHDLIRSLVTDLAERFAGRRT